MDHQLKVGGSKGIEFSTRPRFPQNSTFTTITAIHQGSVSVLSVSISGWCSHRDHKRSCNNNKNTVVAVKNNERDPPESLQLLGVLGLRQPLKREQVVVGIVMT
jgi:hypothetical protein